MADFYIFHVCVAVGVTMAVTAFRGTHVTTSLAGNVMAIIVGYAHRPAWLRRRVESPGEDEQTGAEVEPDE